MVPTTKASSTWTVQQLDDVAARLEWADPTEILAWAVASLPDVVVAASFEDLVLVHLVHESFPALPIAFLRCGSSYRCTHAGNKAVSTLSRRNDERR